LPVPYPREGRECKRSPSGSSSQGPRTTKCKFGG
jgi:hypothetical protein